MESLPRTSTVSQTSSTLTSHDEQQAGEPTDKEAFIPEETQAVASLKYEHGDASSGPNDHITRKPATPYDTTSESVASIVGGFVAGIALATSHHIFLAFLNGRNIDEYSQYWVKNTNNAFSALFSICIAFVAACALIQMKWNVARSKPLSIRTIDNLFALPSPVALFTTVTSTRLGSLRPFLLPIFAATFIQSLALVSVFAPNALTVAHSSEITRDIQVPTLNLSTGPITSFQYVPEDHIAPSQLWTTILTSIMLQPPIFNWKIPPGCGAACKFDLVYDGPGLQCTDKPLDPPPYTVKGEDKLIYNATSTLYQEPGIPYVSFWEMPEQYELQIGYITTNSLQDTERGGSVHCVFRNATYKASFQVENNTMEVNHSIQSYGVILGANSVIGDILGASAIPECSIYISGNNPCFNDGVNTRAICEVFASALTGTIEPTGLAILGSPSDLPTTLVLQTSNITGGINIALIDLLFSHASNSTAVDFHLAVSNLSESLVSLFSNLTLGFIPYLNDTTTVRAVIWDGSYAWSYTVWVLWAIYLPTLLLASFVILSGLLSIRSNNQGIDDKFSSFLLATRNKELDDACMDAKDFAELQRFRLLYGREGTFSVASGGEYPK